MSRYKRPSEKRNIVGRFCRTYSCSAAIEKLLNELFYFDEERVCFMSRINWDFYLEVDDDQQIVWPKDCNTPYNAFDLVRINKFGESDLNVKEDTPPSRMPSYKAMLQLCKEDAAVRLTIIREKNKPSSSDCKDWQASLTVNDKNEIEKTGQNIRLILLNDSELSKVRFDRFTKKDITHKSKELAGAVFETFIDDDASMKDFSHSAEVKSILRQTKMRMEAMHGRAEKCR